LLFNQFDIFLFLSYYHYLFLLYLHQCIVSVVLDIMVIFVVFDENLIVN